MYNDPDSNQVPFHHSWKKRGKRALLYVFACLLVALATLATRSLEPLLGESISPLFFAAVMLAAWTGGLGPGLAATALAGWCSAYYFPNNPPGSTLFSWDDLIRLAVFLLVSVLISSLTSLRKRAQDALRQSYEVMEQQVVQRTAQLQATNVRLKESEERFRTLVEGVQDYSIVMLDPEGHIVSWNEGAARIFGFVESEVLGKHVSQFFPADERDGEVAKRHLEFAALKERHAVEGLRVRKRGDAFLANVITTALHTEGGALRGYAQITRDITELRQLERDVLQISEAEQRRIGHDLHDGLGQELTGLALLSQSLADQMTASGADIATALQRMASLIAGALEQARQLAHGFAPIELGPEGLPDALQNLTSKVAEASGMSCKYEYTSGVAVDDEASLHLFRIAQEALSNALRHSRATALTLSLQSVTDAVCLTVRDNGIGFELADRRRSGMGLGLMHYRASMIGAELEITSGTQGTTVKCTYGTRHLASPTLAAGGDLHQ
jgi:two-component system sensor kinase FixL